MTLVISQNDAVVVNDVTLQDAPAVRITGTNVHFTNSESGRLISSASGVAALVIEGTGATIVNELEGIISAFQDSIIPTGLAILGQDGVETIISRGRIAGDVSLAGGNDSFTQAGFFTSQDSVDLGGGDDFFTYDPTANDTFVQEVHGGTGTDTLRIDGDVGIIRAGTMSGMEVLEIGRDVENVVGFSGFDDVVLEAGSNNNLLDCDNPDADVVVIGGLNAFGGDFGSLSIGPGTVFKSIAGTAGREAVTFASASVVEGIALGGGDDEFIYLAGASGKPDVGGAIDGGGGRDLFRVTAFESFAVDLSAVQGFEELRLDFISADQDVRLDISFAAGFDEIEIGSGLHAVLLDTNLPAAAVTLSFQNMLGIGAGSAVASVTIPYTDVETVAQGDLLFSAEIDNDGSIGGDVRFAIGDDLYDGRNGSAGGTVYGFAGNDRLLGGSQADRFDGGFGADSLEGGGGNDTLTGGAGNDFLDGGDGFDSMTGGLGNDTFIVDGSGEAVAEAAGEGTDTIFTSASYALTSAVQVETLAARDNSLTTALSLTGNQLANTLLGNNGANFLDGGGGSDIMFGFAGDDIYVVGQVDEGVFENAGGGNDTVYAETNYALAIGNNVENLAARDNSLTVAMSLTGNELANNLYGNNGANFLDGGAGSDVLFGFAGDDIYVVGQTGEGVFENAGGGNDMVYAETNYALAIGNNVENLAARDNSLTVAISLTGNELGNNIYGNNGANFLDGRAGSDVMFGFAGDDIYVVDQTGEGVFENADGGNDTVYAEINYALAIGNNVENLAARDNSLTVAMNLTGNEVGNNIYGNNGANILDGGTGSGADALYGFGGADIFAFTSALGGGNVDFIADMVSGTDKIGLDDGIFGAIGASLDANEFVLGAAALDADDRIIYNQATGQLFYDADGNGAGAAVLFANLQGATALTVSDFAVI